MALAKWDFDPAHSSIGFTVRHMVVSKVHGRFTKWNGSLEIDDQNPSASKIEVTIEAASVDTHDAQRDGHLRTGDFFEVEKHPNITFKSTGIEKSGDKYAVRGDLTIRGVTRPIAFDVEATGQVKDPWGKQRAGFSAHTSIDRKEFGVSFNQTLELGGLAVSEKVDINIDVEATKSA